MATDWTKEQLQFYLDMAIDGFSVTVRYPGDPGTFNPETLVYTGATANVDVSTFAIRAEYSINNIDGTRIQSNDSMLIIPAYGLSVEIDNTTQILINSVAQNVISVKKVAPANVIVAYKLQVRS